MTALTWPLFVLPIVLLVLASLLLRRRFLSGQAREKSE
jgi:cytochrome c-type biogenesis protein CcmH